MKLPQDIDSVCLRALGAWGIAVQERVAIGEIGELLTLVGRSAQHRDTPEQWTDEIADVIIMCHQLAISRGLSVAVEDRIAEKLPKIEARIDAWAKAILDRSKA